jgi:nitroreductase
MTAHQAMTDDQLAQLFTEARTQNAWTDRPVPEALLHKLYDVVKFGPTSANCCPARFYFVTSPEAKAQLKPWLSGNNAEKTMAAPVCVIIGTDYAFADKLPELFPIAPGVKDWFADPQVSVETAERNASLQGGYLILAARALGLDCGPMSGFDKEGVNKTFFAGTQIRANFLCNLGYGDPKGVFPRMPRLAFDDACKVL